MRYKNLRSVEPTESQIQCAIVEWANNTRYFFGNVGDFLIAIKNEGKQRVLKNKKGALFCPTGNKYNKEGRKKGVSDLFLAIPVLSGITNEGEKIIDPREILSLNKEYNFFYPINNFFSSSPTHSGLWIEVKSKKGKISEAQENWAHKMKMMGYSFAFVWSVDSGIQSIKDYLGMRQT